MSGLFSSFKSPWKGKAADTPPKMPRDNPTPRRSMSVTRLAKTNPYDEIEVGGEVADDVPLQASSSQRANPPRTTSNTPIFSRSVRPNSSKTRRWAAPILPKRSFDEFQQDGPKLNSQTPSQTPQDKMSLSDSFDPPFEVPKSSAWPNESESSSAADEIRVDSGARHTTASPELDNANSQASEIQAVGDDESSNQGSSEESSDAEIEESDEGDKEDEDDDEEEEEEQVRITSAVDSHEPDPATDEPDQKTDEPDQKKDEPENDEQHEIKALLKHQFDPDGVQLLVYWAGEPSASATWEREEEIQENADAMLFAYWERQGGRDKVLFEKPKDRRPAEYHVFRVLQHEKAKNRGFRLEVQWVGYPAHPPHTTWEPESKLMAVAPDHVDEYWNSRGGRGHFLNNRGRNKEGTKRRSKRARLE